MKANAAWDAQDGFDSRATEADETLAAASIAATESSAVISAAVAK